MGKFTIRLSEILFKKKWHFLIIIIIITIGLSFFIKNIKFDNSLEVWFLKDDPTLLKYNEFKKLYGNDEIISVWIKADKNIYDQDFVKKLYDLSIKLGKNPLIKRVLSITKAPYIDGRNNNLIVEDMVKTQPDNSFNSEIFKKRLESNPLLKKTLLTKDSSATILLVEPVDSSEMDIKRPEIIKFVKDSLIGFNYKLAGMGVMYDELNRISFRDSSLFTSLSYVILIIALFLMFRKFYILITSTATIIICIMLFLGIYGLFNQSINMVSAVLPSLIIILGLEDIIFIFSSYYNTPIGKDRLTTSVSQVIVPCFFTSFTTAIGFFAFVSTPMEILKSFGLFAALGVMIEFFISIIVSAFVLAFIENKKASSIIKDSSVDNFNNKLFNSLLININSFYQKNYKAILFSSIILLTIAIFGSLKLRVDTYSIDLLLDSNKIKQDSKFIEENAGFYLPMEIRLKPKNDYGVKDPEFLNKLDLLQKNLDKKAEIEKSTSLVDIVKQLNMVLTDNTQASYKIPDTRNKIAQELLLYELDNQNDLSYFVDDAYTEIRLTVRIPMVSSRSMKSIMDIVNSEVHNVFHDDVEIIFGGYIPLYIKLIDYIAESQVSSFILAFLMIFITTGLLFRSFKLFFIIIIPNIIPIILTLGFMGFSKINLDIATVTIAAIAIGISVDNTIHFLFKYKIMMQEGLSTKDAIQNTMLTTGKPMIISNLLLVIGYMVMLFASIKSIIYFGLLIALTLLIALVCDILLLPSLLLFFNKEKN